MAVTPADIAKTLVRSAPAAGSAEFLAWELWIEDARRLIQTRLPDLASLDQPTLDYVVREAVALKAKRPDPVTQISVAVEGEASTSKTYEKSTGLIEIRDEWWAMLTPETTDGESAWTINPFGKRWSSC